MPVSKIPRALSPKPQTYYDLLDTLRLPGCAVCRVLDQAVRQRIDAFLYEQLTILERRTEIRDARGFCSIHATMFNGMGHQLGNAILQQDVLNDVLRDIEKIDWSKRLGVLARGLFNKTNAVAEAIKPKRECVLCAYEREQEKLVLRALINEVHEPAMRQAFAGSSGVCLPHFRVALEMPDVRTENMPALIELETAILRTLKNEVDEYIHKRNASFDHDAMGSEADAPQRALKIVSGRVIHRDGR